MFYIEAREMMESRRKAIFLKRRLTFMRGKLFALGICALIAGPVVAADSVVIGHAVSNHFLSLPPCPDDGANGLVAICLDANYVWELKAVRTIAGPPVEGIVRAIASQHTQAKSEFVRSVELFVLRPITDQALRKSSRSNYYIVELSAKDSDDRYCLSMQPAKVGLQLDSSQVVANNDGDFCFKANLLGSRIAGSL
jgi:hypothetical protein